MHQCFSACWGIGAGSILVLRGMPSFHTTAVWGGCPLMQQADMESNGKRVSASEEPLTGPTGALVFGEPGTDAQHAFFQWLHQGTDRALVDLIGVIHPDHDHR